MTPLDSTLAAIADQIASAGPSLFTLEPAVARARFDQAALAAPGYDFAGIQVEDRRIGPPDSDIAVRIYRPATISNELTTVFLHGGGYMLGGLDQMDGEARMIAYETRSVVVSVDYRLAPEHRLPAAHDDAVAAVEWVHAHAAELGGDAARIAIAGESAGANLAASAAIALRDKGIRLAGQLLIVPAPDLARFCGASDIDKDYPMLSSGDLRRIAQRCLPEESAADRFPYSAVYASDLEDLSPVVIGLAGHCPARHIGKSYAEKLRAAGNHVVVHDFDDMFHPFFAFARVSERAMGASRILLKNFASLVGGCS